MSGKPALKDRDADVAERNLIEAAKRDPGCFADLYEENFERVYAYIARRVGDRDQAQDVTADVFHKALRNLAGFEWRGVPFAAWLLRIAANEIASRGKRSSRASAGSMDPLPEAEKSSEAAFEEAQRRARLFKLVEKLPPEQRQVITMRFAHQKSIAEISRGMRRTEGAIKQLQFRALKRLRTMVDDR